MKYVYFLIIFLFILGTGLVCLTFQRSTHIDPISNRLQVVCTIGMITDVVKNIGGECVDVVGLMGSCVDPHLYKAREGDIQKLCRADIIFFNGLHLEGKMGDLFHSMSSKAVPVTRTISKAQLIEVDFNAAYDPHVWHDVKLWTKVVKEITNTLIVHDQLHAQKYEMNSNRYIEKLQILERYVKNKALSIPTNKRILVTAHDAFSYFGRAYGFDVIGLQGISTDSEISTKDIQKLTDFIVQKKIPVIFFESSLPQRNIQAVQRAVQARGYSVDVGPELFSDTLGEGNNYIDMMMHNIDAIVAALGDS